jgi:enoyl-CoA hydratase/carnithine racemase
MADSLTILQETDGVAVLTLNRPEKRNALSRALRDEIVRRLDALEQDDAVRVVILTGAAPAFCAGFDRTEFTGEGMEKVFADAIPYHHRVYTFAKPLIAAVNGAALGGGCDLAAMCDLRLAATTAVFGQPQLRFGAPAVYELMRAVMGAGAAREMCLTGRSYDAREALAMGLVNRVVDPDELLERARALARETAALPAGVAEAAKRSFLAQQPRIFEP